MTRIGWFLPGGGEANGEVFPLGPPSSWPPGEWGEARGPVGTPRKLTRWVRRYEQRQARRARRRRQR
jgi:hypothetical protein